MKHYTNTFHGHTTVVVEIEKTLPLYQQNFIEDMLNELARGPFTYSQPLTVINKHDEDISVGHRFVVLCRKHPQIIESTIADILEIVSTGSLITETGLDLLAKYKEAAE